MSAAKLSNERLSFAVASSGPPRESESLVEEELGRAAAAVGAVLEVVAGARAGAFLCVGLVVLVALAFKYCWCCFGVFRIDIVGFGSLVALDGRSELAKKRS